jgi:thiosulfate/3-mercaptopyruvate sulfurtransferase
MSPRGRSWGRPRAVSATPRPGAKKKVSELGIGAESRVVVYGSSFPDTARVWWMLKYLGLDNVAILDGGWDAWLKGERPSENAAIKVPRTQFAPRFDAGRLAEIDSVKESIRSGKVTVVDARTKDEFTGKEVRGKRGGHITGAIHLEWKELLAGDGRFKTRDELQKIFRERGILPDGTAVCY